MLKIAICDDERVIAEEIAKMIEAHLDKIEMEWNIFTSGEELLQSINNDTYFDIIFLDIEMGNLSGIDLANTIRNTMNNYKTQIAFVTSKEQRAKEACKLLPLDFIDKPFTKENIISALERTTKIIGDNSRFFIYSKQNRENRIFYNDIYHFESNGRRIKITSKNEIDEFNGRISEIEEQLKTYGFIRVHKSFVINSKHITKILKDEVIMTNEEAIPVSRNYKKHIISIEMR